MIRTTAFLLALCAPLSPAEEAPPISRIAFGSCCQQSLPSPIFKTITRREPQLWIWMGDNIYGDTTDMEKLEARYAKLAANKDYAKLRTRCEVIGTWDDHDYGRNDAGKEFPQRATSQQRFLDFLGVPADHPRRKREGVYASHTFGPEGKQLKVILLDTRYHRDKPGPGGDVLGETQWAWLEKELRGSTAQAHLLVSSIQVIASDHRFEKWANFPTAKSRLFALLAAKGVPPVTILSGDRHLGEISVDRTSLAYPLYDFTSSSLNKALGNKGIEKNRHRVGDNIRTTNFGTLEIDWTTSPPSLQFSLRDESGKAVRSLELKQARSLTAPTSKTRRRSTPP